MTTKQQSPYTVIHEAHNVQTFSRNNGHNYVVRYGTATCNINFLNGKQLPNQPNGILNESLIAILIDRLITLDSQKPCSENTDAIYHLTKAADALKRRSNNESAK